MSTHKNQHTPEPKPFEAKQFTERTGKPIDHSMTNSIACHLGEIAICAGDPQRTDVGDHIDRGLILARMMDEAGFDVIPRR